MFSICLVGSSTVSKVVHFMCVALPMLAKHGTQTASSVKGRTLYVFIIQLCLEASLMTFGTYKKKCPYNECLPPVARKTNWLAHVTE